SMETLRPLLEAHPLELPRRRCRLLLGYAGWGPRQLDRELAESAWLTAPADPDLVFATPADEMWETAIRGLGVDPMALTPGPGVQWPARAVGGGNVGVRERLALDHRHDPTYPVRHGAAARRAAAIDRHGCWVSCSRHGFCCSTPSWARRPTSTCAGACGTI